ncbi:MAG: ATP phosphoribosyltransferase [Paracoccaceae bacterium]
MTLRLGVPSKGRLMEATFDWFAARGIRLTKAGARDYAASAEGLEGLEVSLLSAGEVPGDLAAGRLDLGVTGQDMVRENVPAWDRRLTELAAMGFGHADLILAVPDAWVDVATLDDLDAVCAQFRADHGRRLRIATKYHRLTTEYLRAAGVADYRLIDSQGATEGVVRNETAEAIADITSTGDTLRANRLRPLEDDPILRSQAVLFARRDVADARTLAALRARLGV